MTRRQSDRAFLHGIATWFLGIIMNDLRPIPPFRSVLPNACSGTCTPASLQPGVSLLLWLLCQMIGISNEQGWSDHETSKFSQPVLFFFGGARGLHQDDQIREKFGNG
uniref:Uncharacterized protein n=1 Tax=Eutreptiella gymnastica TaxID=73025 RepID=A0A6U8HYW2_9EUGL